MDQVKLAHLIETLVFFKRRKDMYLTAVNVPTVQAFLRGLTISFRVWGCDVPLDTRAQVTERLGWRFTALGIEPQMREKGCSEEEIIDELIKLEIETWQTYAIDLFGPQTVRHTSV